MGEKLYTVDLIDKAAHSAFGFYLNPEEFEYSRECVQDSVIYEMKLLGKVCGRLRIQNYPIEGANFRWNWHGENLELRDMLSALITSEIDRFKVDSRQIQGDSRQAVGKIENQQSGRQRNIRSNIIDNVACAIIFYNQRKFPTLRSAATRFGTTTGTIRDRRNNEDVVARIMELEGDERKLLRARQEVAAEVAERRKKRKT